MAELQDSSVLFSLEDLMEIERQRIQREEAEDRRKIDAERAAQREAELAARAEQEARLRAEEHRRRQHELRRREEAARLEAIREAELVRARTEAAHRARVDRETAQRDHELRLEALRRDAKKNRHTRLLVACSVAALVVVGGGLAYLLGVVRPEAARRAAREHRAIAGRDARLRQLEEDIERRKKALEGLESELRRRDRERSRAAEAHRKQIEASPTAPSRRAVPGTRAPPVEEKPPRCTSPWDPMCGTLDP